MSSHDHSQLSFVELVGLTDPAHLYQKLETHQELFFKTTTIPLLGGFRTRGPQ